jgi:hypothetical protein
VACGAELKLINSAEQGHGADAQQAACGSCFALVRQLHIKPASKLGDMGCAKSHASLSYTGVADAGIGTYNPQGDRRLHAVLAP